MHKRKIRVFIVEDQVLVRKILRSILSSDPDIEVVGEAGDPYEASELIPEVEPDVLTLDIEMPKMNGLEFLKKLLPQYPIPVIMLSSFTTGDSAETIQALERGAIDFITKPNGTTTTLYELEKELLEKVKIASKIDIDKWLFQINPRQRVLSKIPFRKKTTESPLHYPYNLIVIGASTGGVNSIRTILSELPPDFPATIIVQHMPPGFTKTFADRMASEFGLDITEAKKGDKLTRGKISIIPGDFHGTVSKVSGQYIIELSSTEKVNGHRPSIDVLFQSVANNHLSNETIGIILTGMGGDGAKGLLAMKKNGSYTIGQDQATSIVYGMPKVAFEIGAVMDQEPLDKILSKLKQILNYN